MKKNETVIFAPYNTMIYIELVNIIYLLEIEIHLITDRFLLEIYYELEIQNLTIVNAVIIIFKRLEI